MKSFFKLENIVDSICKIVALLLFTVMTVSAFLQVVFRFVLSNPLSWSEELCRYCMVWMTLIGICLAIKAKAHICVDLIKEVLPAKIIYVVDKFNTVLTIIFGYVMINYGMQMSVTNFTQTSPGLHLPMGLVYTVIPISGVLVIFFSIFQLLKNDNVSKGENI